MYAQVGLCCAIVSAVVRATPAPPQQPRVTVNKFSSSPNTGDGEYSFEYELSDGSYRSELVLLKNTPVAAGERSTFVAGSYRWIAPGGESVVVDYTVDGSGYHPEVRLTGAGQRPPPPRPIPPSTQPVPIIAPGGPTQTLAQSLNEQRSSVRV